MQISKEMLVITDIYRTGSDFPPTFKVYVSPSTSGAEINNSPSLKVKGLGEEGCHFQLVAPSKFKWIMFVMYS